MKNILAIWTVEGLLRDQNEDGVIDGVSVFIDLPQGLAPEGLIDFCARLGVETTSLSFTFFEEKEDTLRIGFVYSGMKTELRLEGQELIFYYKNEEELSSALRLLAVIKSDLSRECTSIEFKNDRLYAGEQWIPTIPFQIEPADEDPEFENVSHLWSFSGFGRKEEASPSKRLNLNINVQESLRSTNLLREICLFAARGALYSTEIAFPLTGNTSARLQFDIVEGSGTTLNLVEKNRLCLTGEREALPPALYNLVRAKHWSEGGAFGYWEQEHMLAKKPDPPLLYEVEWSDEREVDLAFNRLKELGTLQDVDIEIFLSEPLEVRKRLQTEWKNFFPFVNSLLIRSAFKPGFHWIMEEILPSLHKMPAIISIEIKVRKEQGDQGLELPIRWIQELYPVDRSIEEKFGIDSDSVQFLLESDLDHTYEIYGVTEHGESWMFGHLDVPVSKLPYLDQQHYVYPVSGAVRIVRNGRVEQEHLIQTDRERFYHFYINEVLPKLRHDVSNYRSGQGHTRPLFDRIEIEAWMSEAEQKLGIDEERISSLEALHEDLYFNTLDYFAYMGEELEGKPFNAPGGVHPFMHVRVGEKPKALIRVFSWEDKLKEKWITNSISFQADGSLATAKVSNGKDEVLLAIHEFEKPSDHLHPDVQKWINSSAGFQILYPDHSYRGHAIPIFECFLNTGEEFYAPLKMSLFKKTLFIEAGHHSNEVSSTPAIFELLKRAEGTLGNWLKEVNLVILPLANPDGYELLTKLTREHPEWKHHAARYNAVGLEYSLVRFQETVFGEANLYPEILRRWAPDIIVDNHGIPSHEWVQPFAGYNSPPRFPVSYFLPSAKIYGIGRLSSGVYRPVHEENLESIAHHLSRAIRHTPIEQENEYWKKRFVKYGNQWMPHVFPIEEVPGIHFYRQTEVTPSLSTNGITRYQEWVGAEIISEAADEVVYGEVLQSCIEAQTVFNLSILDVLQKAAINVNRFEEDELSYQRIRPITLSTKGGD